VESNKRMFTFKSEITDLINIFVIKTFLLIFSVTLKRSVCMSRAGQQKIFENKKKIVFELFLCLQTQTVSKHFLNKYKISKYFFSYFDR